MKNRNLVAALASSVCIVAMAVPAQAQPYNFQIPAGGLRGAIDAYARQTGRQVIYRADQIGNARSNGVRGSMNADTALARLLQGTAFSYRVDASGAIAIVPGEARAAAAAPRVTAAQAQTAPTDEGSQVESDQEIVVTGIRAGLERSIQIKRNSFGVVDAISAEDIGKFPDTNLAESLQRITGVSIDRTNGEGSQVTVRGFGPSYNLVTLNGRTLATSLVQIVGADQQGDDAIGTSRSFDFSNLASEGVRTLEVYKTGRAAIPSGGIGATINVVTRHPLDNRESGFTGSIGAKAVYDASVQGCLDCGSKVTPEVSAVLNWKDPNEVFGAALFGSYQKRNFTSIAAASNNWNIVPYSDFLSPGAGFIKAGGVCPAGTTTPQPGCTIVQGAPSDPSQLVGIPDDGSWHYAEGSRERINGQAVLQFRPTDSFTLTADALFAQDKQHEVRGSQQIWLNRPFDEVRFDGKAPVGTALYLYANGNGTSGMGFEQQHRAQKSKLEDYGLNAQWQIADNFSLNLDGHLSYASSRPDNPNGFSSTRIGMGSTVLAPQGSHSVDYSGEIPVLGLTLGAIPLSMDNLGSTIARNARSTQDQRVKEVRADFGWDLGEGSRFDFGANYRSSNTHQTWSQTNQTLGDWGISNPGDVKQIAPGVAQGFCLTCKFDHFDPGDDPDTQLAFRGDAAAIFAALSPHYLAAGKTISTTGRSDNRVEEEIWAAYGQVTWKGEIGGRPAGLVTGVRFEHTTSRSTSLVAVPVDILWRGGDMNIFIADESSALSDKGTYTNLLPSMDFQVEIVPNLIGRLSASRTIARPNYSSLFTATTVNSAPRLGALGGVPTATTGNARLLPLTSDNFDVSFEYYYKPDSFVSVGFFDKRVHNFIGNGQFTSPLFGLRDSTSGAPGTISGSAKTALEAQGIDVSNNNMFAMSALIQELGSVAAAQAEFNAHYNTTTRVLDPTYFTNLVNTIDVATSPNDPLYQFQITRPINTRDAEIYGFEIAGQHFFGSTGFGIAAAYTLVRGDVGFNLGADPREDQFALLGLSDTFNATLIYDKHGLSARLAYNWRAKYLSGINRQQSRNPVFTAPFGQLDFNVSYDVTPNWAVSLEGINLTRENVRTYARDERQLWYAQELDRRFMLGTRFKF